MSAVAIIGGGISGLTAAYLLQRAGHTVTVFEGNEQPGGKVVTDVLDGCRVDAGAQLFGSMYRRFLSLVREIGLGDRLVRVPGRDALWRDGRAHEVVYGSTTSMIASGSLPLRTKLRLGASYVPFLSKHRDSLRLDAPELAAEAGLDGESIATWGKREVDSVFVRSLVYPQLGAYYGSRPEETSAGFYHILACYGLDVALYAIDGGAGEVPRALAERIMTNGGKLRTGTAVEQVEMADSGVTIVTGSDSERFDAAISAIPAPALLSIASGLPDALVAWLAEVRFNPTLSVALTLDSPVGPRYFGLSFPQGETRYVAAVAIQENKEVELVPAGRGAVVALPTPEAVVSMMEMESRAILDLMLPEISAALPGIARRVTRARVYRWPLGTPVMFPGYLRHLGAFRRDDPERSSCVAIAGDYLYGPSVEGAVLSAESAVARLQRRLG
ncbi:MAG: FAD-dependent oxidoreductase [Gemmatimonadota bacterium]